MKDFEKIVSGLSKSGVLTGAAGGVAGSVLTGVLMGNKSTKKMGKKALQVGAMAAIGGLAWKAYKHYSDNKTSATVQQPQTATNPTNSPAPSLANQFDYMAQIPVERFEAVVVDDTSECGQMLLVRAMITAAYADGHIDSQEQQRIFKRVDEMDLSTSDKASLFDELRKPLSVDQLVGKIPNSETAVEAYAASLIAVDLNAPASRIYLQQLGDKLFIPSELRQSMLKQLENS